MPFLVTCPHCGPREATEFVYGGEVMRRPTGRPPSRRELSSYLYFRENLAGPQREWWFHSAGRGRWLIANRDTRKGAVADTRMLRSWAGLCDISPDYGPILGTTEVDGFLVSAGWGTYCFKAAPIVGSTLAELIDSGEVPELIEPFSLERFYRDELVSELAAAATSH